MKATPFVTGLREGDKEDFMHKMDHLKSLKILLGGRAWLIVASILKLDKWRKGQGQ